MRKDNNTPRLALLGLLTWFSQHQKHDNILVVDASLSRQHRVKAARRRVLYQHEIIGDINNNTPRRRGSLQNVVVNSGRFFADKNDVQNELRTETHHDPNDHGTVWVFHASSKRSNQRRRRLQQQQRQLESESTPNNSFFRQLFEQFFGADPIPGIDHDDDSTNVTTEVEFETSVDPTRASDGNYSSNVVHGNNSSIISTNTTHSNATIEGNNITESVVYTKTEGTNDTSLDQPQYQPLRIRAILAEEAGNGKLLNETEREILFRDLLSPALLAWSSSLRVDPVVGNLTVDVHQLLDGETCGPGIDSGLPSVKVPLEHLEEGVPETDMLVYLSLGFAIPSPLFGNNNSTTNITSGGDLDAISPKDEYFGGRGRLRDRLGSWIQDHLGRRRLVGSDEEDLSNSDSPGSPGRNLDTNSVVTNETNFNGTINICTGDYLAAASYCSTDQMDRPVAALLHICVDKSFFDPANYQRNIVTLVHELGHALGFNSLSMAYFRRPDGTPFTERDDDGEVPLETIECTGPGTERQFATVALPSEEILQFREVRGGVRVAEIVTPSVLQVVRNQFDCQLLTGAELESGEGLPLSGIGEEGCLGDHWERRLFSTDVMNPIVDDIDYSTRISTLTLAYFADSGWYQVDLSNADVASGWGRGSGCQFVYDTCINEYGEVPPQNAPFFCNEVSTSNLTMGPQDIHGCTPDLSRKAKCSIGQYDLDLPLAYQYFNSTYGADVGGSDPFMDFCPIYSGFDNGACSSPESIYAVKAFDIERFGERNSRCLVGNVPPLNQNSALCLPIACVIEDRSLRVKVEDKWHVCKSSDQTITSTSVTVVCPDPKRICPTFFCPYDCLGTGGQCNYTSGHCLCEYNNTDGGNGTLWSTCGVVPEVDEMESSNSQPILRPSEPEKQDPAVPPPGSSLDDYYVSDVEKLEGRPLAMHPALIALLSVAGLAVISSVSTLWMIRKKHEGNGSISFFACWKQRTAGDFDSSSSLPSHNREKHKMIASVLVDMRIRGNERNSNESIADTEDRLTESEVASGPRSESMSDVSGRQSETMSDIDTSREDMDEHSAPAIPAEPQFIRRRRIFPDLHSTPITEI